MSRGGTNIKDTREGGIKRFDTRVGIVKTEVRRIPRLWAEEGLLENSTIKKGRIGPPRCNGRGTELQKVGEAVASHVSLGEGRGAIWSQAEDF